MPIARNSFIQLTKLSNVKGRITYISSHAKQENLYAVYETTERKFWRELAKCNQEEFAKSGTLLQLHGVVILVVLGHIGAGDEHGGTALKLKKVRFQFGKNICLRWMKQCNILE